MMRVGLKRIREAGDLYRGALAAYERHTKGCHSCHVARRDNLPMRFCEEGWPLAKAATRAWYALERARGKVTVRENGEQLAMF